MPVIGTLASAAQKTFNLDYCPQYLLIESVAENTDPTFLNVQVRGLPIINITALARIVAFQNLAMHTLNAASSEVGNRILVALGRLPEACNITITNGQATTPNVYAFSTNKSAREFVTAGETTLNANDNRTFKDFSYLAVLPANIEYMICKFKDGYSETMQTESLDALYSQLYDADANGQLNGHTVVCAEEYGIEEVYIQTTSGGSATVLTVGKGTFAD